jgi:hypothetical protein
MLIKKWFKLNLCLVACLAGAQTIQAQSYVPEWNDTRVKIKPVVPVKAYAFDLKDVNYWRALLKKRWMPMLLIYYL